MSLDWIEQAQRDTWLESLVERDRFPGPPDQAAHWQRVRATTGRTRQDRSPRIQTPVKDLDVRPLQSNFREVLPS